MDRAKPWYLSRTIWAALVTIAAAAAGLLGLPIAEGDAAGLTDTILETVTAIAGLIALVGRLAARSRIGGGR